MIDRLDVGLNFGADEIPVGTLIAEGRSVLFRYRTAFIAHRLNLSPLKLRLDASIQRVGTDVFGGLFGVFADSLPDGWGRLLVDRSLTRRGIDLNRVNQLDRLSYVGAHGRGALVYRPYEPLAADVSNRVILDDLAEQSSLVLNDHDVEDLPELLKMGGSSGGARPKVHAYYNAEDETFYATQNAIGSKLEPWIIKFNSRNDPEEAAGVEYAYYLAAKSAGLGMAECRLLAGTSGRRYFATRRFDRSEKGKLHLHSFAGLVHDDFQNSALDYGHVMDAAFRLERSVEAYCKVLRLAAFNVFAHNRDDHSKNVSFLMDREGNWRLAPAYDLTFSRPHHGQHSLTVAGEGRSPTRKDLLALAKHFGVKKPDPILDEVWEAVKDLPQLLREHGVARSIVGELERHLAKF